MAERKFASLAKDEIDAIMDNVDAKNTKRQTSTAVKMLRQYLTAKNMPINFESFTIEQLDDVLSTFYLEMRNKDGEMYKKTTMQSYRQGLQRYLNQIRDIDISKDELFKKSTKSFKCMMKQLKRVGLAAIEHYPAIEDDDMGKMYDFFCQNLDDAQLLQYKVFVDIMIHFGRRGRENLANLTREHFAVKHDSEKRMYVYKVLDEQTKNHQSDSEKSSDGRMYEIKDSDRCPVRSFVKYIRRLHPKCIKLFQQARSYPKDNIYYDNVPLGHNRLGQFMSEISKAAGLCKEYTNHSCRATTVHVLDEADIPSRHIMSVTGHKSESSLKTYSGKTCEKTKKRMSELISEKTSGKSAKVNTCVSNVDFLCLSQSTVTTSVQDENIPVDTDIDLQLLSNSQADTVLKDIHLPDDDGLDDILKLIDIPNQNSHIVKSSTTGNCPAQVRPIMKPSNTGNCPLPVLNNCQNITVNINYNVFPQT